MGRNQLETLFNPRSVAVFGASASGNSVGSRVFENLLSGGFDGSILPINPKHSEVLGHRCFASILDVDRPVDLAVIATPAIHVSKIIRQCGEAGVGQAIVLSAGFGEAGGEGEARQIELLKEARNANLRFLGPNCVGMIRPWLGFNATFVNGSAPPGGLALVSQSGALCSAIADWATPHHLGFSAIISLGNSANIDFADTLDFLTIDPKTKAILLYIEGIRDARGFISALRAAASAKPVIVLKAGRHLKGSEAASTHTGSLIGSDAVFDAALERTGAVRAQTFGQLFAAAEVLSANVKARGRRLAVITNGGGAGVLAADRAGDLALELPKPAGETIQALDAALPAYWSKSNPIDILGDAGPDAYRLALESALNDPNFDGVLVMLTPQAMTSAEEVAEVLIGFDAPQKPILACWMGQTSVEKARSLLDAKNFPVFTTPEKAVEAFSYLARHDLNRRLALETPSPVSDHQSPDIEGARMIIESALSAGRKMLSDLESKAILRAFHIPVNLTIEARSADQALIAAETLGFPIAMKINSPDITHKSDVGGVHIGISQASEVRAAYDQIVQQAASKRPDAEVLGVTVERMAEADNARELVIGTSRDPVFGPAVLFGAGGTMVEILRDSTIALPPLNSVLASRLIDRTRVSKLLEAFRDRPAVNRGAVIEVLLRVSDLICELPEITELDINPLFAGPSGAIAVDARIKVERPDASLGRYDHVAISPYPRHFVSETYLADGRKLVIRPIRSEDAENQQAFIRDLSDESRRLRFMHSMSELSPQMLARLTQIDYSREMALIAAIDLNEESQQIGVARYITNTDEASCEFAVVVADEWRQSGIGTRLMKALIEVARHNRLSKMEGIVLATNDGMLDLMKELGFQARPHGEEPGLVHVERLL